jgi:hypothetical protein
MATDAGLGFLTPTVTDKQLDAGSLVTGAGTVLRERVTLGGGLGADLSDVKTAALGTLGSAMGGLIVRPYLPSDGTNTQPAMDAAARAGFQKITDGTNLLPTADVAARALFARLTDGTNLMPTADVAARAHFTRLTDGTNLTPAGDAIARSIFHQVSDGTTGPVKVLTGATPSLADKALQVALAGMAGQDTVLSPLTGLPVLGQRNGSAPTVDGRLGVLQMSTLGNLKVAIVEGAAAGGTSAVDAAAFTAGTSPFTPIGGVFNNAVAALTAGQMGALTLTSDRALRISIVSGGGSGGTAPADASAFTAGVTLFTPGGGVFNDAVAALTAGQMGGVRLTASRAFHVAPRDSAGNDATDTVARAIQVSIVKNTAGSTVVTDAETIARNDTNVAKIAGALYHGDGTGLATNARKITQGFSNNLAVTEHVAMGTSTTTQVTVDSSTVNGVLLVPANANRRRVLLVNEGTVPVRFQFGNITAGSTTLGGFLAGVAGAQVSLFTNLTVRATCAVGTQPVTVVEEVLG